MLTNAYFWFYFTIFFSAAFLTSLGLSPFKKRKSQAISLFYAVMALASLSVFWLLMKDLAFSRTENLWIFLLSAVVPGVVTALFYPLILFVPGVALALSLFWGIPLDRLGPSTEQVLGQLVFYPAPDGLLYFEWTGHDEFFSATLEGKRLAVIVEKQEMPEYLFFLESAVSIKGFTTVSGNISALLETNSSQSSALPSNSEKLRRNLGVMEKSYPGLVFKRPGFFNSYTYKLSPQGEVSIIEGKTLP